MLIISCDFKAPHLILLHMKHRTYHLAMSSCIILRISSSCNDCALYFHVCAICFFPSRHRHRAVREGVPLHHPWRSRSCFLFRSDRRAHLLHLFYSFTLVVLLLSICCVLLSHVSFPPVTMWAGSPLRYLPPVACCLSLAGRSACLGICCYLYICWVVG